MGSIENLVATHLKAWNAPPGADREESIAAAYSADVFVGEPHGTYRGHAGVAQAVSGLQAQLPGTTIQLSGPIQVAQDMVTYSWSLGSPDKPEIASGRDVLLVRDDRIVSLYVVIDAT